MAVLPPCLLSILIPWVWVWRQGWERDKMGHTKMRPREAWTEAGPPIWQRAAHPLCGHEWHRPRQLALTGDVPLVPNARLTKAPMIFTKMFVILKLIIQLHWLLGNIATFPVVSKHFFPINMVVLFIVSVTKCCKCHITFPRRKQNKESEMLLLRTLTLGVSPKILIWWHLLQLF